MNGNRALIDSNIIILASKNELDFQGILSHYDEFYISIISYIEVLGFSFRNKREQGMIKRLLDLFEIAELNMDVADISIAYRKKKKIKLPDAVILATAKTLRPI